MTCWTSPLQYEISLICDSIICYSPHALTLARAVGCPRSRALTIAAGRPRALAPDQPRAADRAAGGDEQAAAARRAVAREREDRDWRVRRCRG